MTEIGIADLLGEAESAVDRWRSKVDEMEVFLLRGNGRSVSGEADRIVRGNGKRAHAALAAAWADVSPAC